MSISGGRADCEVDAKGLPGPDVSDGGCIEGSDFCCWLEALASENWSRTSEKGD